MECKTKGKACFSADSQLAVHFLWVKGGLVLLCLCIGVEYPGFKYLELLASNLLGVRCGLRKHFYQLKISLLLLLLLSRFSRVRLCATPQMAAHQAPPSMGFSRQEYWSGVPLPSPKNQLKLKQLLLFKNKSGEKLKILRNLTIFFPHSFETQ